MPHFSRASLIVVASVFSSIAAAAQQTGTVTGHITTDTGVALAGAIVTLDSSRTGAESDARGDFLLANASVGAHLAHVHRTGYTAASAPVTVIAGDTTRLSLTLTPSVSALETVTVYGSHTDLDERRDRILQVPGGVALIDSTTIRASRQANLRDVLEMVPGVFVQPRFGAADESQISIRGSGLRNNFHARGINLLVNGMPYRNADGFTDFESLELLTTETVEVYKGANALRYGGSTMGGAIDLDTKTGYTSSPIALFGQGGAFGFYKAQLSSGGERNGLDYYASYARTSLDGYRDWSAQSRDRINLHAGYALSPSVDARVFYFFAHVNEQLPGSLTRGQMDADPRAADSANAADRWGRDYDLHHIGAQLRAQLSPTQRLEVSPYFQFRDIDHPIYQVIAQISRDVGAEVRYENTAPLGSLANRFTVGVQPAYENMANRQYVNVVGEHGALTKNQTDQVRNLGVYAENVLSVTPRLSAVLGGRFDFSQRETADHFLSDGDQSDRRTYRPFSPKVGVLYALPSVDGQLFANASRSFEPPLLLELNSLTVPGFVQLEGQSAWQYEIGTRGGARHFQWDVSLYDVELHDEILNVNVEPFPNAGFTVPTYRNADRTRHYGIEAGLGYELPATLTTTRDGGDHLSLHASYTFARYRFVRDSTYAGNDIPGAPKHLVSAAVTYAHPIGLTITPSVQWSPSGYFVNSANSARNDAWTNVGLRADWKIGKSGLGAFASAENLLGRVFSPSVQVDNADGKYFEPVDGRSFYAGLRWNR